MRHAAQGTRHTAMVIGRRSVVITLLVASSAGCGGSGSPTAAPPAPNYSGAWTGRTSGQVNDNLTLTVQGQQITAASTRLGLSLSPLVNLGGGQFAVSCVRTF